jgi:hypothetical protein
MLLLCVQRRRVPPDLQQLHVLIIPLQGDPAAQFELYMHAAALCNICRRVPPDLQKLPVPIIPLQGDLAAQLTAAASARDVGQWNPTWVSGLSMCAVCKYCMTTVCSCPLPLQHSICSAQHTSFCGVWQPVDL